MGDGDHGDILVEGSDIRLGGLLVDGDGMVGAQNRHPRSGEGQAGSSSAFLFGQDRRDRAVVVMLGESPDQGDGLFIGDARRCLPVLVIGTASSVAAPPCQMMRSSATRRWRYTVRPISAMTARMSCLRSRAVVVGASKMARNVGAGGGDPGQFLVGQRNRAAGALGGQIVFGGADRGQLSFQVLL